jgi:hypothetical protein
MNSARMNRVKQVLAAEWGAQADDIDDLEAKSWRRRDLARTLSILLFPLLAYIYLRLHQDQIVADALFLFIATLVVVMSFLALRHAGGVGPGSLMQQKQSLAEALGVEPETITDESAAQCFRDGRKRDVYLALFGALVGLYSLHWKTLFADAFVLLILLMVATLSLETLLPVRRRVARA